MQRFHDLTEHGFMGISSLFIDLDGTLYHGSVEVPGASAFVRDMRAAGIRSLFVTNRSNRCPEEICEQLQGYGIDCGPDDVVTSAQATARYLKPGRVYVIGEAGLESALRDQGFTLCDDQVDYVIVGWDRGFTYDKLHKACSLIGQGAQFVGTNPDKGIKLEDGYRPGTGALLAAVSVACGNLAPMVIGKPEPHLFEMALAQTGLAPAEVLAIGDNLETDIRAAIACGLQNALILTGVTRREELATSSVKPDMVVDNYDELREQILARAV